MSTWLVTELEKVAVLPATTTTSATVAEMTYNVVLLEPLEVAVSTTETCSVLESWLALHAYMTVSLEADGTTSVAIIVVCTVHVTVNGASPLVQLMVGPEVATLEAAT